MCSGIKNCGGAKLLRKLERYLTSVAVTYMFTTVALSFLSVNNLDLYVSLYILEYFTLTLLHSPLQPKTQKTLNLLSYALFAVFLVIFMLKVLEITWEVTFF